MRKRGEIWLADLNPRRLKKHSDALIDQVRAIDNRRLVQGPLWRLQPQQLDVIAVCVTPRRAQVFGFSVR